MIPVLVIHFFIFLFLINTILAEQQPKCEDFDCRNSPDCGELPINCSAETPTLTDIAGGKSYQVKNVWRNKTLLIHDQFLEEQLRSENCDASYRYPFLISSIYTFKLMNSNLSFFKCDRKQKIDKAMVGELRTYGGCREYVLYYSYPELLNHSQLSENPLFSHPLCSVASLPLIPNPPSVVEDDNPFTLFTADFYWKWELSDECLKCSQGGGLCLSTENISEPFKCFNARKSNTPKKIGIGSGIASGVVGSVLSIFMLIYFARKKRSLHDSLSSPRFWKDINKNNHQDLEAFFKTHGSLAPKRYSFKDVKKMTNSFKEKLGQGGYGSVFKGMLNDGRLVAVKVLFNNLKTNNAGVEFMNEVASISRTSHVNIVTLFGFCYDKRNKRALIYEFMPNGSLEKYIYGEKPATVEANLAFGWEMVFQVAIEIARGLEYLHRGCTTRILHFDIKPHNILLDEDFHVKISDFGLARLCLEKESFISMSGARGTAGYIAPEVFNRNFGGITNKSDVYSYGMMILEMVGGRKNIDVKVGIEHPSQLYFPHQIYDLIKLNEDLGLHGIMTEEREQAAKKMIIVGLWCIQTNPLSRPSMSKVLEMLEGSVEALQIPPKPFLSSPPRSPPSSISSTSAQTS